MADKQNPKPPLPDFKKRGLKGFFGDVASEMRKVIWPSREDTVRLTGVVLLVCIGFVIYLFGAEQLFSVLVAAATGEKSP